MAENIWTNVGADRAVGTIGNWTNGAIPANGDHVKFLSDFTAADTGPNATMNAAAANHPATLFVGKGFTQDIGATGGGATGGLDFDYVDVLRYRGSGGLLWYVAGGGVTPWAICDSQADSPTKSVLNITGATVTKLDVLRGGCTVDGSGTVTNVVVGKQTNPGTDANLTLESGAAITLAEQYAGVATSDGTVATARIMGGTWSQATAIFSTALYVFGGIVNLDFAGVYPIVHHYGGVIDVSRSGGRKTFTNYYHYPGVTLISTPEMLTVTNDFPAVVGSFT